MPITHNQHIINIMKELRQIDNTIEELLTTLHNEPELEYVNPLSQEEIIKGRGIKWQMENATSYTYKIITKTEFEKWLEELYA